MRIYSMTATFGKLQGETLTLQPGLNVISAHNEWGKSTWCAFLVAMLYGLDTRAKSTKNTLADKERYAPWSGSPMSGRIDLCWQGRDITIERVTRGRIPMGDFRAYETASGLEIPELTGENCGAQLLGVEKSVFVRSGFIRFSDLPVSDDEALRQRLINLVTTGEESGAAHRMGSELKNLKNRIRYRQSGLLPQAEAQRDALADTFRERERLQSQMDTCQQRLDQVDDWRMLLENHRAAMAYAAFLEDESRVAEAKAAADGALQHLEAQRRRCAEYPSKAAAQQMLQIIDHMDTTRRELEEDLQALTQPEPLTGPSTPFDGMRAADAFSIVEADVAEYIQLIQKRYALMLCGLAVLMLGTTMIVWNTLLGGVCLGLGLVTMILDGIVRSRRKKQARHLEEQYGSLDIQQWWDMAGSYAERQQRHDDAWEAYHLQKSRLQQELDVLLANIQDATKGDGLDVVRSSWEQAIRDLDAMELARREWEQAEHHYKTLRSMLRPTPKPELTDRMEYSEEETAHFQKECQEEYRRLENRMHQYRGQMEALGSSEELEKQRDAIERRIEQLELHYHALTIAQNTLAEARLELQRRFAPQIARRAQELLGRMTGGRYNRVRLDQNLGLRAGAKQEDVLREALWRSDGTVDQLYLALRLAVAETLTPDAPLILDDALVRFDDDRLQAAMEILKEEAAQKQVVLFTCHDRESNMM